jgi:hypothetical protein
VVLSLVFGPLIFPLAERFGEAVFGLPRSVGATALGVPACVVVAVFVASTLLRSRPDVSLRPLWVFGSVTAIAFLGLNYGTGTGAVHGQAPVESIVALWLLSLGIGTAIVIRELQLERELRGRAAESTAGTETRAVADADSED